MSPVRRGQGRAGALNRLVAARSHENPPPPARLGLGPLRRRRLRRRHGIGRSRRAPIAGRLSQNSRQPDRRSRRPSRAHRRGRLGRHRGARRRPARPMAGRLRNGARLHQGRRLQRRAPALDRRRALRDDAGTGRQRRAKRRLRQGAQRRTARPHAAAKLPSARRLCRQDRPQGDFRPPLQRRLDRRQLQRPVVRPGARIYRHRR